MTIDRLAASGVAPPPRDPDADILQGLARGDPSALGLLMERHLNSIKSTAYYMLNDPARAEDIAQEVFIRAWKQAPNWQTGRAKFSTWLHRVAKNLCYDALRKKTETLGNEGPELVDERISAIDALIETQLLKRQKRDITDAMAELPERQRLAIILCHYQDFTQKQAAEIMDINVRAYESLLARGRKNLQTRLTRYKDQLLEG